MKKKSANIRPWLFVIGAFALLMAAWSSLIFIAVKHTPERIEVTSEK
ncbi:MAG: hypothetical protein AB8D78_06680 [Akkermansiaceae bacterium]